MGFLAEKYRWVSVRSVKKTGVAGISTQWLLYDVRKPVHAPAAGPVFLIEVATTFTKYPPPWFWQVIYYKSDSNI